MKNDLVKNQSQYSELYIEKKLLMNTIEKDMQPGIAKLLGEFNSKAVIFDLDGTLIDNNYYHLKTWKKYLENIGINISEEEYNANINGRTNKDAIKYIYSGRKLSDEEILKYTLEKEALYREIYQPFITPIPGLIELLTILKDNNISLIHISEPTRQAEISYAVFCLKKKK